MTPWIALENMLQQAIGDLPNAAPLAQKLDHAGIVERELATKDDVDAALNSFSGSGHWPLVEGEESYFLELRLRFGIFIAKLLAATDNSPAVFPAPFPAPPEDFSVELQIQWLLLAAWNAGGREAWAAGTGKWP